MSKKPEKYDFSGWATRFGIKCSDGRTITHDAFAHCDGKKVPLVWNHCHNDPNNILGHGILDLRDEGMYVYGTFNDTDSGRSARALVHSGDIESLSICANKLKEKMHSVLHGEIREVSLVIAGANPGAYIDTVSLTHSDDDDLDDDYAVIYSGDEIMLHSDEPEENDDSDEPDKPEEDDKLEHADKDEKEDKKVADKDNKETNDKTIQDVVDTMNEEQKTAMYAIVGQALAEAGIESEEDVKKMKHNVFDNDEYTADEDVVLTHADQAEVIKMAHEMGSFKSALTAYGNDVLQHGFEDIDQLFPDYKDVFPGAPELITRDRSWVASVLSGVRKSPISRIRTRKMDVRDEDFRGLGYKKKDGKIVGPDAKLLQRTTDPQTVYRKDALERDDIIDITDFDVVEYQYQIMKGDLEEELARAILIGDGRDDYDDYKISEDHIRSIYNDDELYTIHRDVDFDEMRATLNGTDTNKHFGENYIYAEAIVQAALYAREDYKGSGNLTFYCTPHLLNVMLLARDLNGRRIYSSINDLAAALNVKAIETVEQFQGQTRTVGQGAEAVEKSLLGIFANLNDYQVGSTKGGEITRFSQFDIDFNKEKYLIETRLSGALIKIKSAIVLEEVPSNF